MQVPENVKEAKSIDQEILNKLWEEAMVMEMTNNWVSFELNRMSQLGDNIMQSVERWHVDSLEGF